MPIRILEFRCADGSGGGPEKTILLGAAQADPRRFAVSICYLRSVDDNGFDIDRRAKDLGLDFACIAQRHRFDAAIWREVRRLVREKRIDIVHSHDYKTNFFTILLSRAAGIIPLSTAHGYSGHSWLERRIYYPADRRILGLFPLVIAVSPQLRNTLVRAGVRPHRIRTVLNGIDHRRFRRDQVLVPHLRQALGLSPGEIAVGAVGRVERGKRFDLLLRAVALLLPNRPNLRLLIVGEGSQRGELERFAEGLGIAPACCFLGHRADVDHIYPALDVLVQSSDYEGTSNVVLEAMALETPIVATDVGGTADLVRHGVEGLLVPLRNAEAMARAIQQTIDDPKATAGRVAAARRRVEGELSFDARMRKLETIYCELAHKRARCRTVPA